MQLNQQERAGWLRLGVPAPARLAQATGCRGEARWVAFHWEPCGDEFFYDDGRSVGMSSGEKGVLLDDPHRPRAGSVGDGRDRVRNGDATVAASRRKKGGRRWPSGH